MADHNTEFGCGAAGVLGSVAECNATHRWVAASVQSWMVPSARVLGKFAPTYAAQIP